MSDENWETKRQELLASAQAAILALYQHMAKPQVMRIPLDDGDTHYAFVQHAITVKANPLLAGGEE